MHVSGSFRIFPIKFKINFQKRNLLKKKKTFTHTLCHHKYQWRSLTLHQNLHIPSSLIKPVEEGNIIQYITSINLSSSCYWFVKSSWSDIIKKWFSPSLSYFLFNSHHDSQLVSSRLNFGVEKCKTADLGCKKLIYIWHRWKGFTLSQGHVIKSLLVCLGNWLLIPMRKSSRIQYASLTSTFLNPTSSLFTWPFHQGQLHVCTH